MNHFYILRSNREAGPFTREDLKAHGLLATDLIWVDGESKEWKHPSEINRLESIVVAKPEHRTAVQRNTSPVTDPKLPASFQQPIAAKESYLKEPEDEPVHDRVKATVFGDGQQNKAFPNGLGTTLFGVAVLLIGLLLCGFVVINMLKQFSVAQPATSEAVEIQAETLPVSTASHTAEATQFISSVITTDEKIDSATQLLPVEKKLLKTTPAIASAVKTKVLAEKLNNTPAPIVESKEAASTEPIEETADPVQSFTPVPSLQLSANDYKVGLFGGVSNLEITIANPSGQAVAKALVEIEYLKPNGNVVKTQTVTAENIPAGGSSTIQVPSSSRGVKVRYHVVNAE